MTIERARVEVRPKPWGVTDLRPWSSAGDGTKTIGELCFHRPADATAALLFKLLFTREALSIQVHPDDAYAHSMGLPNGKAEAWYVLSAKADSKVAVGLKAAITPERLGDAIDDGSIAELVNWRPVQANDTVSVPAGLIHAIGAGLVIAEIQQRSDATFRMYDYGRARELHADDAVGTADLGLPAKQPASEQLSPERTLLVANSHFIFERITLPPNSRWLLDAASETWLLVLDGECGTTTFDLAQGEALFAQRDRLEIRVGDGGLECLVAYTGDGKPAGNLLVPSVHEYGVVRLESTLPLEPSSMMMATITNGVSP